MVKSLPSATTLLPVLLDSLFSELLFLVVGLAIFSPAFRFLFVEAKDDMMGYLCSKDNRDVTGENADDIDEVGKVETTNNESKPKLFLR